MKSTTRKNLVRFGMAAGIAAMLTTLAVLWADQACHSAAAGKIFRSLDEVPQTDVALVLGTGKFTPRGFTNRHFTQRIQAAAELYHAGKVRHLIVSGDNHIQSYDEPADMRDALVAAGVPATVITCDYAGFRTLDSVVRAHSVFGLTNFTIVSEAFHCPRALWIAKAHGLEAIAFAAPDLNAHWSDRLKAREVLARVKCGLDLHVLRTQPKFPGPREPLKLTARNP